MIAYAYMYLITYDIISDQIGPSSIYNRYHHKQSFPKRLGEIQIQNQNKHNEELQG
jgi:hypothetical protein